jgi:hypothetical protein
MNTRVASPKKPRRAALAACWIACLSPMLGCEDDKIREVRVPRERSGLEAPQFQAGGTPAGAPGMGTMNSAGTYERLLIAMIDRPESTYFLRVESPTAEAIDALRPEFDQLVQSLQFDKDIRWTLPTGWSEREGGAMFRIATLKAPSGLEVFVTKLTAGQEVLSNVNRWQGQLGLPNVNDAAPLVKTLTVGEQTVILYDQRRATSAGTPPASSSTTVPPSSGAAAPAPASPAAPSTAPISGPSGVPFAFPPLSDSWTALPPSMVAVNRWERTDASGSLKLEVFRFPTDASFLEMISIWGERISAAPPTETTFAAAVTQTTIDGQPAELVSWPPATSGETANAKSIQVARVIKGDHAWYIKLEGDSTALTNFGGDFQEFLANIRSR